MQRQIDVPPLFSFASKFWTALKLRWATNMDANIIWHSLVRVTGIIWCFLSFYRSVQYRSAMWHCKVEQNFTARWHCGISSAQQFLHSCLMCLISFIKQTGGIGLIQCTLTCWTLYHQFRVNIPQIQDISSFLSTSIKSNIIYCGLQA